MTSEAFADAQSGAERTNREASLNAIMQRYAERLAHYTRGASYNWFNFYDFWHLASSTPDASSAAALIALPTARSFAGLNRSGCRCF